MGKEIESVADEQDITISCICDIDKPFSSSTDFDVAIDFTTPSAVINNVEILANMGKNIVIGTTGWYDKIESVRQIAKDKNVGIVWSSNFSIGMQMFFQLAQLAATLIDNIDEYDIMLNEIHHSHKSDAPSGTALNIANIILSHCKRKNIIQTETLHRQINPNELHISSLRGGHINGQHNIIIDSKFDTITLQHNAKTRRGFAVGAIQAAKWLHNKKGFYCFDDVFHS